MTTHTITSSHTLNNIHLTLTSVHPHTQEPPGAANPIPDTKGCRSQEIQLSGEIEHITKELARNWNLLSSIQKKIDEIESQQHSDLPSLSKKLGENQNEANSIRKRIVEIADQLDNTIEKYNRICAPLIQNSKKLEDTLNKKYKELTDLKLTRDRLAALMEKHKRNEKFLAHYAIRYTHLKNRFFTVFKKSQTISDQLSETTYTLKLANEQYTKKIRVLLAEGLELKARKIALEKEKEKIHAQHMSLIQEVDTLRKLYKMSEKIQKTTFEFELKLKNIAVI